MLNQRKVQGDSDKQTCPPALPVPFNPCVFCQRGRGLEHVFFLMCEINHMSTVVCLSVVICLCGIFTKLQIQVTVWFVSRGEERFSGAEPPLWTQIISLRKGDKHISVSGG